MSQQSLIISDGATDVAVDSGTSSLKTFISNTPTVKAQLQDNSGNAISSTSGSLNVFITGGSSSGGTADKSAFAYGTTSETPIGGVFQDTSPSLTAGQTGAVRLTANRAFHVNLRDSSGNEKLGSSTSANSIPVVIASDQGSFTISANQSGTWTVQPGNTANTTPWLVTDSSDGPVTAGTVAAKSSLAGGQFNTSLPSLTTGQQAALQVDSSGRLLVGSIASALPTGANTIGAVTQASGPWTQNITQFGGTNISTGTGTGGAGIPRVTVSSDSNVLATQSGTWTVQQGNAPWSVVGNKSNNNATPSSNHLAVLPAIANASAPSYTDGYEVLLSTDTTGHLRVRSPRASTSNVASVASSVSSVTLLSANANRLGATIFNDSTKTLYIKLGASASTSSFTVIVSTQGYYEVPFNYTGQIDGVWSSAAGFARITELTA